MYFKSISPAMHSSPAPHLKLKPFHAKILQEYHELRQRTGTAGDFDTFESLHQRLLKEREERTQSKSKNKARKVVDATPTRVMLRRGCRWGREVDYRELGVNELEDKKKKNGTRTAPTEADRLKNKASNTETKIQPVVKTSPNDPVYEFYSREDQIQSQCHSQVQHSEKEQLQTSLKDQPQPQQSQLQPFQQQQQSASGDDSLQGWTPSKLQSSLLSIQKLIDEYIIFRSTMRARHASKLSEIIKYVRDINGYFFTASMFQQLVEANPRLYQLGRAGDDRLVRARGLTSQVIDRRLRQTRARMRQAQLVRNQQQ